jgi:hypothetical protein
MSDEYDDEQIGQEAEASLNEEKPKKKRTYVKRIPATRRQEAINLKILGKEDPEFHVIETSKKGSYIVRKRVKPLLAVQEQAYIPSNPIPQQAPSHVVPNQPPPPTTNIAQGKSDVPVLSYFSDPNTAVNYSLSKELSELRDMYNRLEDKYVKVKKTLKKTKEPPEPKASKQKKSSTPPTSKSKEREEATDFEEQNDDDLEPAEEEINAYV